MFPNVFGNPLTIYRSLGPSRPETPKKSEKCLEKVKVSKGSQKDFSQETSANGQQVPRKIQALYYVAPKEHPGNSRQISCKTSLPPKSKQNSPTSFCSHAERIIQPTRTCMLEWIKIIQVSALKSPAHANAHTPRQQMSMLGSVKTGCIDEEGFLVDHSGGGRSVTRFLSSYVRKPTRSSNRKTPPESSTRKPFWPYIRFLRCEYEKNSLGGSLALF